MPNSHIFDGATRCRAQKRPRAVQKIGQIFALQLELEGAALVPHCSAALISRSNARYLSRCLTGFHQSTFFRFSGSSMPSS